VPVVGEPALPAGRYGDDRVFVCLVTDAEADSRRGVERHAAAVEKAGHPVVRVRLEDPFSLGGEVFRWEVAVAAAGSALGVHPFNQPDVELAKDLARRAMTRSHGREAPPPGSGVGVAADDAPALGAALQGWLTRTRPRDYLALQAYIAPSSGTGRALQALRRALSMRTGLATTLGYGPRFLHSTGQLHKGGPDEACILQLVDEPAPELEVPETDLSFGALVRAQALGDYQALLERGRRVLCVDLKDDPVSSIGKITEWVGA